MQAMKAVRKMDLHTLRDNERVWTVKFAGEGATDAGLFLLSSLLLIIYLNNNKLIKNQFTN